VEVDARLLPVGEANRQLEQAARAGVGERGVRVVVGIRRGWVVGRHPEPQVEREQHEQAGHERVPPHPVGRHADERGEAQAGDRHEACRDARLVETRHVLPERAVAGEVRTEREGARHDGTDDERGREPVATLEDHGDDADGRDDRQHPADEDCALEAVPRVPGDEVEEADGIALDLLERTAARANRAPDRGHIHGEGAEDRGQGAAGHHPDPDGTAKQRVKDEERHRAEGEVNLARERDRRERRARKCKPGVGSAMRALERIEREREQHRHRREQMAHRALGYDVGREREREPARERPRHAEAQFAQPEEGRGAGAEEAEEDEGVPPGHCSEQRVERPEDEPERPPGEVRPRVDLGLEAVRVEPGRLAALQLVTGEPELPDRLEMVAGGGSAGARGQPLGEEGVVRGPERGPGADHAGAEVRRDDEDYKSRAAATMASKSGTSASS